MLQPERQQARRWQDLIYRWISVAMDLSFRRGLVCSAITNEYKAHAKRHVILPVADLDNPTSMSMSHAARSNARATPVAMKAAQAVLAVECGG